MATRIPASPRAREGLTALIEGRLSTASAKDELVKLATRLNVEEALEGEAADAIGRDYYEHGAQSGQGYRNGYRTGRLNTAEGAMEYSAPADRRTLKSSAIHKLLAHYPILPLQNHRHIGHADRQRKARAQSRCASARSADPSRGAGRLSRVKRVGSPVLRIEVSSTSLRTGVVLQFEF
jgi:hypothetical protein